MRNYASKKLINSLLFAILTSILLVVIVIPVGQQQTAVASPYSAGYDHGCDDAKKGGHPYLDEKGGAESHTVKFMQGYDAGYGDCSGNKLKKYDSNCPAGSANPDEGCELEGYHCTSSDGCGNYVHGVCETCTTMDGSSSSSSNHKGDFKIKVTFLHPFEAKSTSQSSSIYIQEHPQYETGIDLRDYDERHPETANDPVTYTLTMPKGIIADGETFHVCVDKNCFKMVNHEGKHVESITIDGRDL